MNFQTICVRGFSVEPAYTLQNNLCTKTKDARKNAVQHFVVSWLLTCQKQQISNRCIKEELSTGITHKIFCAMTLGGPQGPICFKQ